MTKQQLTTLRQALTDQGRTWTWLARQTGKAPATVRAYSCGVRRPPESWVEEARAALGLAGES